MRVSIGVRRQRLCRPRQHFKCLLDFIHASVALARWGVALWVAYKADKPLRHCGFGGHRSLAALHGAALREH